MLIQIIIKISFKNLGDIK